MPESTSYNVQFLHRFLATPILSSTARTVNVVVRRTGEGLRTLSDPDHSQLLQLVQRKLGGETIEFNESFSQKGTIALFRRAKAVIGVHGSGLTNQVWCAPGTPIIEIVPFSPKDPFHNDVFHKMSYYLGLHYYVVPVNAGERMYSFQSVKRMKVDNAELAAALDRVVAAQQPHSEI